MKKKRKGAWKRTLASVLGMVLVVVLTIVGTLAFLQTKSNEKTNVFTGSNDIKLYLEEPNYNLREVKDANGNVTYEIKDENELDPREYVPGMTYPKDPTLYNITGQQTKSDGTTTELAEEWVAMRVDYAIADDKGKDVEKSYSEMVADYGTTSVTTPAGIIEDIVFDVDHKDDEGQEVAGNWIKLTEDNCSQIDGEEQYEIYVYKYKLKANENVDEDDITNNEQMDTTLKEINGSTNNSKTAATTPLFESITIKDQDTLKTNGYDIKDLKKFTIKLTGAAIKDMVTISATQITESDIKPSGSTSTDSQIIVEDLVSLLTQQ